MGFALPHSLAHDRHGFAACCEDAAMPFRVEALDDLSFALRFESCQGAAQNQKGHCGRAKPTLTTGGKAVTIVSKVWEGQRRIREANTGGAAVTITWPRRATPTTPT